VTQNEIEYAHETHLSFVRDINMIVSNKLVVFCGGMGGSDRVVQTSQGRLSINKALDFGHAASFGFQNCIIRLIRLLLLPFSFLSPSIILGARDSIESLLFSPWELLIKRDKLAMLDRFRVTAAEESEAERWPSRN